ncbi:P-loop containing nucleoside triphosphate hydrolase protein [Pluteus cervinus]|uniref:P-loop containing nucleoside triphosphate hydrolase protein n=1 Tax=Pluteus cervinus TaxID=181527 RepID=A0ACD3BGT2_9AGAR|nr:P-loop containing nucleoside triphosphate hydrolase protein [Pluteus cervinus]
MQFDSARKTASSFTSNPHGVKRPLTQRALSQPSSTSATKVPRVDHSQASVSASRVVTTPSSTSSSGMPSSSHPQSSRAPKAMTGRLSHQQASHNFVHGPSSLRYKKRGGRAGGPSRRILDGPFHDEQYIQQHYNTSNAPLKKVHENAPKSSLGNFSMLAAGKVPAYEYLDGVLYDGASMHQLWRTTVTVNIDPPIIGVGDAPEKKASENLAALSAVYQLHAQGLLDNPKKLRPGTEDRTDIKLSDGTVVTYERARSFMDYYCRRFGFSKPEITFTELRKPASGWEAVMAVNDRRIGLGTGTTKKAAQITCYLDVTHYLEDCDPALWKSYTEAAKTGADLGMAPKVWFQMSDALDDEIRDLCADIKRSTLYRNRPSIGSSSTQNNTSTNVPHGPARRRLSPEALAEKSRQLLESRNQYLSNPKYDKMRATRMALPVYSRSEEALAHFRDHDVSICMAATGSGKTTQIPQIILDEYIARGEGAHCNIICTQPRRLAAISVADRIAKERGESLGQSVGYQVRFEARLPQEHGSITFCTTGIFLKKLQSAISPTNIADHQSLDDVTHILVDEVHERDVDTDLLLVVLKRLLEDRRARQKPLKIVLMSATIDPTLFQKYFTDAGGQPAKVIEIPGRSFPVTKNFLEDFIFKLTDGMTSWILRDDSVIKYLNKELSPSAVANLGISSSRAPAADNRDDDPDLPYPLIAATVSHVLRHSEDGHVLVFLPGWEEITAVQRALQNPGGSLGLNFSDTSKFSIHLLHSTIPLAEQQVIFDPPPPGVRRIILATNIAETSVTIPDVVYVVDTARIKEQRYDPERHMSSLISAWVGSSNLNQRAGRAGRHRPGEYYGIIGQARVAALHPYQTVEMKRVDLSNVVMHVKALNFPGMSVEEVLGATIEAPHAERVSAAIRNLQMVGALDADNSLTSLGRVLLQLPVEAQVGRLVLYGSFFRCLDQALTLAAILTNRDPFVSPMHLKAEAAAKKNSWTPQEFRSDALATLQAYNAWWSLQSTGDYGRANRFCMDNFLAKPTLLMIQKIKVHLLQSLYHAGVIDVSAGGRVDSFNRPLSVPRELNVNGDSLPLLAALIASASQPKYAIRTGEKTYRTSQDKATFIHPSSVNHRKRIEREDDSLGEKQLFAYTEKRQNISNPTGGNAQTFLVTTTRLDPMTYMLFGAYKMIVTERYLECDNWLPIASNSLDALDDIQRLKTLMEGCMLRVFEGIAMSKRQRRGGVVPIRAREEEPEFGDEGDDKRDYSMSREEVQELDRLTSDVVRILNRYNDERVSSQSRQNSRPATPMGSPALQSARLPYSNSRPATPMGSPALQSVRLPGGSSWSGYSTPNMGPGSAYNSRPGTPSRLGRGRF